MNKKLSLGSAIAFLLIAVALTFTITMSVSWRIYNKSIEGIAQTQETFAKLSEVDQLVKQNYLFETDPDKINDALIRGYLEGLADPYAEYVGIADAQNNPDTYNGKDFGFGITYVIHPDTGYPYITLVHNDSSAKSAGVQAGDQLISIDGKNLLTDEGKKLLNNLEQTDGKVYPVTVSRGTRTLELYLKMSEYDVASVTYETIDDVGYIRIWGFNTASVSQFKTAIASLQQSKVCGLILDVRHNSGGSVPAAREMLDLLLPEGTLYTAEYSDGSNEKFTSDKNCVDLPMTVLVDEKTASAAELFAGVIKDFYTGPLIGETTYGKGIMQRTFTLSDGSEIKFTTAYLLTPLGNRYHGKGIVPNNELILNDTAKSRFYLLTHNEDAQLQAAFSLLTETKEKPFESTVSSSASSAVSSVPSSASSVPSASSDTPASSAGSSVYASSEDASVSFTDRFRI